jgi:hypothetical protein
MTPSKLPVVGGGGCIHLQGCTLNLKAACSSEFIYVQITWYHIPEEVTYILSIAENVTHSLV